MSEANSPIPINSSVQGELDTSSTIDVLTTCLEVIGVIQSIFRDYPQVQQNPAYSKVDEILLDLQSELQKELGVVEPQLSEPPPNLYRDDETMNSRWFLLRVKLREALPNLPSF